MKYPFSVWEWVGKKFKANALEYLARKIKW